MSRVRLLLVAGLLVSSAGAIPAFAEQAEDPLMVDPCGDAGSWVTVGGQTAHVEESHSHIDLRSGDLRIIDDDGEIAGVVATLDVCGEASSDRGAYRIGWGLDDGCTQGLAWTARGRDAVDQFRHNPSTDPDLETGSQVIYDERCDEDNGLRRVFRQPLPDETVTFDGATVTFTLTLDLVPEEGRSRFDAGTIWGQVNALAVDQDLATITAVGQDLEVWVRWDQAWADRDFVVELPEED